MQDLPNNEAEAVRDGALGCLFCVTVVLFWVVALFAIYRLVLAMFVRVDVWVLIWLGLALSAIGAWMLLARALAKLLAWRE